MESGHSFGGPSAPTQTPAGEMSYFNGCTPVEMIVDTMCTARGGIPSRLSYLSASAKSRRFVNGSAFSAIDRTSLARSSKNSFMCNKPPPTRRYNLAIPFPAAGRVNTGAAATSFLCMVPWLGHRRRAVVRLFRMGKKRQNLHRLRNLWPKYRPARSEAIEMAPAMAHLRISSPDRP